MACHHHACRVACNGQDLRWRAGDDPQHNQFGLARQDVHLREHDRVRAGARAMSPVRNPCSGLMTGRYNRSGVCSSNTSYRRPPHSPNNRCRALFRSGKVPTTTASCPNGPVTPAGLAAALESSGASRRRQCPKPARDERNRGSRQTNTPCRCSPAWCPLNRGAARHCPPTSGSRVPRWELVGQVAPRGASGHDPAQSIEDLA